MSRPESEKTAGAAAPRNSLIPRGFLKHNEKGAGREGRRASSDHGKVSVHALKSAGVRGRRRARRGGPDPDNGEVSGREGRQPGRSEFLPRQMSKNVKFCPIKMSRTSCLVYHILRTVNITIHVPRADRKPAKRQAKQQKEGLNYELSMVCCHKRAI